MSHAVKCPVCNGTGTKGHIEDYPGIMTPKKCYGCKGKGWINIDFPRESWEISPFEQLHDLHKALKDVETLRENNFKAVMHR